MIGPGMIEALFAQLTNDMHIPTFQTKRFRQIRRCQETTVCAGTNKCQSKTKQNIHSKQVVIPLDNSLSMWCVLFCPATAGPEDIKHSCFTFESLVLEESVREEQLLMDGLDDEREHV